MWIEFNRLYGSSQSEGFYRKARTGKPAMKFLQSFGVRISASLTHSPVCMLKQVTEQLNKEIRGPDTQNFE